MSGQALLAILVLIALFGVCLPRLVREILIATLVLRDRQATTKQLRHHHQKMLELLLRPRVSAGRGLSVSATAAAVAILAGAATDSPWAQQLLEHLM